MKLSKYVFFLKNCFCLALLFASISCAGPWNVEEVSVGGHPSLALDPSSGLPRISYYDGNYLAYAVRDDVGWTTEVVDDTSDLLSRSSLELDPSTGYARIAYFAWTEIDGYHLRYAEWTGRDWNIIVVASNGSSGNVGGYCSLEIDPTVGEPRIAYVDADTMELKYAERMFGDWVRRTVAPCSGSTSVSLVLTATGAPRISYRGGCYLMYATRTLGVWLEEHASTLGEDSGYDSSLALYSTTEVPRIAHYYYTDTGRRSLVYTLKNGLSWEAEFPDTEGWYRGVSLALDSSSGYPRISCYEETLNELRYVSWNGSSWNIETVESTEDISMLSMYSSLVLDSSTGSPRIAYAATNLTRGRIRYAWTD